MAYNDVNFTCCVCGIAITMPEGLYQQRVTDHGEFYCVNGHRQRFTQKDKKEQEIARLREEVRARDSLIETFRSEANELWDEREGLIALLRECPLCDWRSSKRIPIDCCTICLSCATC